MVPIHVYLSSQMANYTHSLIISPFPLFLAFLCLYHHSIQIGDLGLGWDGDWMYVSCGLFLQGSLMLYSVQFIFPYVCAHYFYFLLSLNHVRGRAGAGWVFYFFAFCFLQVFFFSLNLECVSLRIFLLSDPSMHPPIVCDCECSANNLYPSIGHILPCICFSLHPVFLTLLYLLH